MTEARRLLELLRDLDDVDVLRLVNNKNIEVWVLRSVLRGMDSEGRDVPDEVRDDIEAAIEEIRWLDMMART